MSNPEKNYKGCGVVILALFILSVVTNVWLIKRGQVEPEPQVVIEHDTLWRDTTITHPTPTASTQTGKVVYIKVPYPVPSGCQSDVRGQDPGSDLPGHCPLTSPAAPDSIEVPIPIEQKRYDDSLYTAWVSGFRPALDSIRIYHPEITTTITKTIVQKAPRLSVGLSVGPGISIDKDHHMGIYVGFTANYRLWPK
jgi:hypothetical protein